MCFFISREMTGGTEKTEKRYGGNGNTARRKRKHGAAETETRRRENGNTAQRKRKHGAEKTKNTIQRVYRNAKGVLK